MGIRVRRDQAVGLGNHESIFSKKGEFFRAQAEICHPSFGIIDRQISIVICRGGVESGKEGSGGRVLGEFRKASRVIGRRGEVLKGQ